MYGEEEDQIRRVMERMKGGKKGTGDFPLRGMSHEPQPHCEKGASSPISPDLHPFCLQRSFPLSAWPPNPHQPPRGGNTN